MRPGLSNCQISAPTPNPPEVLMSLSHLNERDSGTSTHSLAPCTDLSQQNTPRSKDRAPLACTHASLLMAHRDETRKWQPTSHHLEISGQQSQHGCPLGDPHGANRDALIAMPLTEQAVCSSCCPQLPISRPPQISHLFCSNACNNHTPGGLLTLTEICCAAIAWL